MDARYLIQRIVVVLMGAGGLWGPVYATSVHVYGGDFHLPIPASPDQTKGCMDDAVIPITDNYNICDVDVRINLTHTNVFDLQISLVSPAGTRVYLNKYDVDEFFIGADYILTVFDDEAEVGIEQGQAPFTGRFRPKAPTLLEAFDGQNTLGLWRLRIYDFWYADSGSLDSFELIISTPEPATLVFLMLGLVLTRAVKHCAGQ
ncbi:MAG: proprotein convertase P-domain-containing protein [Planctomycetota bacterium]|jgi:hypothetical protein